MNPTNRTARRRGTGWLTAAGVAAGLLGLGLPPAQAAANQYAPSIGTAVGAPLSGSTATAPVVRTSILCPDGTTAINAFLDSAAAGLVGAVAISSNSTDIGVTSTNGISLSNNLLDIAASQGRTLVNGRYELSVVCYPDLFGTAPTGQFDAVLDLTGGATPTAAGTTYTFVPPVVTPTATTTTVTASPAATAQQGATVTLTAAVSPAGAAGTVQFQDLASGSPVNVGGAVTVTAGTASLQTSALAVGARTLRAVFTPADAAAFAGSTSASIPYTITAPPAATSTTTTIAVSPAGTAVAGAPVTLTATVTPSNAAGTVQFEDTVSGTPVAVGAPVPVGGGTASATTTGLAVGAHQLRARFVPANPASFTASTSAATAYTITAPPTPPTTTTTTLTASPAGTAAQGSPVTLTAAVSPGTAVGSVQFQDVVSGTPVAVGNAVAVSGGTATVQVSDLAVGSHSLRAVFTPTNAADFTTSTSATTAYTITAVVQPPATTTTALAASPADTAAQGTAVTLTATLSPAAAAGTVQFRDTVGASTVNLGTPVIVTGGTATFSTSSLPVGQHSFTAVFTPTDPAAFTASTSSPLPYTVTAVVQPPATTTTTVSASPAGAAVAGASVTFTASVSPAAAGTVQFTDTVGGTPVAVGAPVPVTNGAASVSTTTLAVGPHRIVAAFTPADAAGFAASASAPLAYTITAAGGNDGAVATTLALKAKAVGEGREGRERRDGRGGKGHDEFLDDDDRCEVAAAARLEARVAPRAAGTVQFFDTFDGTTTPVGGPVTVKNGRARLVAGPLAAGTHVFSAVFTPADPTRFQGSTSNEAPVTVEGRRAG